MSEENKKKAGERLKAAREAKRAKANGEAPPPAPPIEALDVVSHTEPIPVPLIYRTETYIEVTVDWQHLDMLEAQQAYSVLQKAFEKAGKILNARAMQSPASYECFMCHNTIQGEPMFRDLSWVNPKTGIRQTCYCCSENCTNAYNNMRIETAKKADLAASEEIHQENIAKEQARQERLRA